MQFLRKIFFYISAAIYIVFCPLIIMYALGYIYKPGSETGVVKTGLIYLSSAPTGADIYINSTKFAQPTPAVIQELLPGEYTIRLVMDGYRQWERQAPVEAEKATVLDKVILLPDKWDEEVVSKEAFSGLSPVPGSGYLLAAKGARLGDVQVCQYRQGQITPLLGEDSPYRDYNVLSRIIVEESPYVLFIAGAQEGRKVLWAELSGAESEIEDVTSLFQEGPQRVLWPPQNEEEILVLRGKSLDRIDISAGAVYPDYVMDVKGFGLFNNEIYYIKNDNTLDKTGYDKKGPKQVMDDPALGSSLFGGGSFYEVKVLSEDYIVFLSGDGQLLANRLPYRFVDKGVAGTEYYEAEEQVLVWTGEKIGILDFSMAETGDVEFEKGPELLWAYTKGKNIAQCFWVYKGSHILFADAAEVFLMAIEEYGEISVDKILDVKEGSSVYYSDQTGKVYYLDGADGALKAIELVPRKSLITVPFPVLPEKEVGGKGPGEPESQTRSRNKEKEKAKS